MDGKMVGGFVNFAHELFLCVHVFLVWCGGTCMDWPLSAIVGIMDDWRGALAGILLLSPSPLSLYVSVSVYARALVCVCVCGIRCVILSTTPRKHSALTH